MSDNEKLIEEALAAYWGGADNAKESGSVEGMRAALTVFEKAHTPTDDEREALLVKIATEAAESVGGYAHPGFATYDAARRAASAALRRSEVPEPSAEGPAFIALMPPSPETSKRWYSMYCRVCGIEEMMAGTVDDPRLLARRDEHNRERHAEPQGEPSDAAARALAIHDAWGTPNDPEGKIRPLSDYTNLSARMAHELRKGADDV